MYVLLSIFRMIQEQFPYKEVRTISRSINLREDLLFDDEELSDLYQWIRDTFGVYIHESSRFDSVGELADFVESQQET